jgi:hypothetical protein
MISEFRTTATPREQALVLLPLAVSKSIATKSTIPLSFK